MTTETQAETRPPDKRRRLWLSIPLLLGLELLFVVATLVWTLFSLGVYNAEGACGYVNRGVDTCNYAYADATLPVALFSSLAVLGVTLVWIVFRVRGQKSLLWGPLIGCLIIVLVCVASFVINSYMAVHY